MKARVRTPFGVIGIETGEGRLREILFLPFDTPTLDPEDAFSKEVVAQIEAYLADPRFRFDLPVSPSGTAFQKRVWERISAIPPGSTRRYGELAREIGSAARAVGQACGSNPIPIVIPCHRVVSSSGLGGFMHSGKGRPLDIKRWLLAHEAD